MTLERGADGAHAAGGGDGALDGPVAAWAVAVGAGVGLGLGVRASTDGSASSLMVGLLAALFVGGVARGGRARDLALALASCAAIARSGISPLHLSSPAVASAPFSGQAEGQPPLLALRLGLFFVAAVRLRRRPRLLAAIAVSCIASLAWTGLVLPYAIAVPVLLRILERRAPKRAAPGWVLPAILVGNAVCLAPRPSPPAPPQRGTPREEVAYWRARSNLFRAHAEALAWARREKPPGEGHVALAEVDDDLGRRDTALRVLAKVRKDALPSDVAKRALELQARATSP